ncbi:hypothetical protein JCM8097_000278 [Rhodosporidiobolus ruineniae]
MAQPGTGDGYWGYAQQQQDEAQAGGAVGGYSPEEQMQAQAGQRGLHRTASEEVQQALSGSLGLSTTGANSGFTGRSAYSTFDPLDHARLSPSAFDPTAFSRQFVMPRFASGGPSDPFNLGLGVVDAPASSRDIASPMPFDFSFGSSSQTPRAEQPSQPSPFYSAPYAPLGSTPSSAYQHQVPHQQQQQQQQQHQHTQQQQQQQQHIPQQQLDHRQSVSSSGASSSSSNPFSSNHSSAPSTSASSANTAMYNNASANPPPPPIPPTLAQAFPPPQPGSSSQMLVPTSAELESPIYAPYGSSVISVNATPNAAYKLPSLSVNLPPSHAGQRPFNPAELGLPAPPPPGGSNNFAGLYSASGFDMLGVLARVAARPNPQIQIGPVDMSCAFAVVDARRWDQPLVFVSDTFVKMTGYANEEIIGRNCRFLQTPGGGTIQGQPRKYTDGNAAWHMRQHIQAGKESQSSLINYTKGGRPFINLVTIIPICWDSEEIAYFVGFQVDLVDQPNAILNRMRDGSYVVNYSLVGQQYASAIIPNPSLASDQTDDSSKTISMQSIESGGGRPSDGLGGYHATEPDEWTGLEDLPPEQLDALAAQPLQQQQQQQAPTTAAAIASSSSAVPVVGRSGRPSAADQMAGVGGEPSGKSDDELLDQVLQRGIASLELEVDRRAFHKLLLGEADDFVHVLSLKGSVLYCSRSVTKVLEYEPGELVGSTLSALCHPSDVVPVMRQLKDASSISTPFVKLLYRIRRKHSGYAWLEATGKLHIEPGKGRKCVIAVGRLRDVTQMNWNELRNSGGLGDTEFFTKLGGSKGTMLFATQGVQGVLGYQPHDVVGSSILDLALPEYRSQLEVAIQQAQLGAPASVQYQMRNRKGGAVEVVTKFYPRHPEVPDSTVPDNLEPADLHCAIIAQTNELSSEERKVRSLFGTSAPVYASNTPGRSPALSDAASNSGSSNGGAAGGSATGSTGAFQSTFKHLPHPSSVSDNVFDELETRRPTSWQFELHQLQNMNKKLRDEKDHLVALSRKRGSTYSERSRKSSAASDSGSRASSNTGRLCQNCGRTDSPEWRAGPNGPKTLCNACGLRYAKIQKQSAQNGGNPPASPTSSTGSTLAALVPMTISQPSSALQSPQQYPFALPKVDEDAVGGGNGAVDGWGRP